MSFDSTEVDFGSILNETEVARVGRMTNTSPLPVSYQWYFVERPPVVRDPLEWPDEGVDMGSGTDGSSEGEEEEYSEEGGEGGGRGDSEGDSGTAEGVPDHDLPSDTKLSSSEGEGHSETQQKDTAVQRAGGVGEVGGAGGMGVYGSRGISATTTISRPSSAPPSRAVLLEDVVEGGGIREVQSMHVKISSKPMIMGGPGSAEEESTRSGTIMGSGEVIESGLPLSSDLSAPVAAHQEGRKRRRRKKQQREPWKDHVDIHAPIPINQVYCLL